MDARPGFAMMGLALACGCGAAAPEDGRKAREPVEALLERAAEQYQERSGTQALDRTLVIATAALPDGLDPLDELDPWAQRVVDDLVFEGLTRRVPEAAPFAEPALADDCRLGPGSREVYCHIPRGRTFHDGAAVEVEDVVYSLEYWLDPRRGPLRLRHGLGELERVARVDGAPGEAPDPGRWIAVGFASAQPLALELLAAMKIVPARAHRGRGRSFGKAPVGTGPMRVVQFDAERLVLERTSDAEAVQRIVFRSIPDRAEGLARLRRGEVHVLDEVAPVHVPTELHRPGMAARFDAYLLTPPRYDLVLYNTQRPLTGGPRLREALDDAVPYGAIDALFGMPTAPLAAPVDLSDPTPVDLEALRLAGPSASFGMAGLPSRPQSDDAAHAEAARGILDGLGWPLEGQVRRRESGPLRLVLMWDGSSGRGAEIASTLREGWRDVGVQVPQATATWAYVFGLMRKGEYDLGLVRLATRTDEDLYPHFHSRGVANLTAISDRELDRALEAYRQATTRAQRQVEKARIAERIAAVRPASLLYAPTQVTLISKRVGGLTFVDDLPRLDRLRLEPDRGWIASP